jgi:hypothetical protein
MRRVLETIAPRGGIVRTDDARNLITLNGNRQDIASMMEAIALFDIDTMKGMSFALVPVKTSQPDAIAGELKTVFASDRDGPMAGMVQFLPNRRLGAILVISPQPQYLRRAESWIRRLDQQAEGSEKQLFQQLRATRNPDCQQLVYPKRIAGTNATPVGWRALQAGLIPYVPIWIRSSGGVRNGEESSGASRASLAEIGRVVTGPIQVATSHEQAAIFGAISSMATTPGRRLPQGLLDVAISKKVNFQTENPGVRGLRIERGTALHPTEF